MAEAKKRKKMSDVTVRRKRTVQKKAEVEIGEVKTEEEQEITTPAKATPRVQGGEEIFVLTPEKVEPVSIPEEKPKEIPKAEKTKVLNQFLSNIKKVSFKLPSLPSFKKKDKIVSIKPEKTIPVLKAIKKGKSSNKFLTSLKSISFVRLSIKDQTFFVKRLSFLIKAGIPMQESLVMIREQTRKRGYISILDKVIANVSNGQNLSSSLGRFKNVFGEFTINLIGFGEESGVLSENLEYIADELKKRQALRKKIISASVYPIIVTIATIGIVTFLMVFLFPKILPIFSSLKYDLPLTTRIVIAISNFISHWGVITLASLIVLLVAFLITLRKVEIVRFYFHKFLLKIPVIGKIIRDYNMANFTRTMGLLLKGGVTMGEALTICAKITPNLVYKKEFKALLSVVNRGSKISSHLIKVRTLFPDLVTQIISVGEHSGNLSNSLIYLSEMYEAEIDDFTKNLSSLVEPVLMIIMGVLVGFIAISIITPIYGITQHLNVK